MLEFPSTLIRAARQRAGFTQAELADRLGLSQAAIAKLEHPRSNPSVQTLDRVLRATGHRLQLGAPAWDPTVDESLIRRHLERTPGERLRGLEVAYQEARKLAEAGARNRGELA